MIPSVRVLETMSPASVLRLAIRYLDADPTALRGSSIGPPPAGLVHDLKYVLANGDQAQVKYWGDSMRIILKDEAERLALEPRH